MIPSYQDTNQGPIFRTFFFHGKSLSAENSAEFLGKTIFRNFFCGKLQCFPTFLGGKISAEFSAEFSLEKMYEKSAPEAVAGMVC
jgi:hypothetical protein